MHAVVGDTIVAVGTQRPLAALVGQIDTDDAMIVHYTAQTPEKPTDLHSGLVLALLQRPEPVATGWKRKNTSPSVQKGEQPMMPKAKLAGAVLSFFGCMFVAPLVNADVLFDFSSTCVVNCASVGLNPGDAVSGTIGVTDSAAIPSGVILDADLTSFDLTFGNQSFGLTDLQAFAMLLDPTGTSALAYSLLAQNTNGLFLIVQNDATANNVWAVGTSFETAALGGPTSVTRVAAVPEPGSIALLLLALGALALCVRADRGRAASAGGLPA